MEKREKNTPSIPSLVLMVLVLICVSGSSVFAEQEGTDNTELNQQELDEVTASLEALEAQRQELLDEKESLQIDLWGTVLEEEGMNYTETDAVFEASVAGLMGVDVMPVGTLTQTTRRTAPAAITTITKEQIWEAGAHSLNELLEIYVPNLQYGITDWRQRHLGIRGITGEQDLQYLMLVNGRVMNNRTVAGALSERDLPMMGDIHHIDVVRGPASAIYGPGAEAGVINIVTENGLTFKGTEIITKLGAGEEFGSFEFKHGRKFARDIGAYFYLGIDKYKGADQDNAPYISGRSFSSYIDGYGVEKGDPVPFHVANDNQAWANSPRIKFHAQLTVEDFDFWARYSKGGQDYTSPVQAYIDPSAIGTWGPEWNTAAGQQSPSGTGYEQFTVFAKYVKDHSDTFNMEYILSYDKFRYLLRDFSYNFDKHDEDELFARALARWTPNEAHSIALGAELSLEKFNSMGTGNYNAWHLGWQAWDNEKWNTETYSVMGEWQYKISDEWKTFVAGRFDKNSYSDELFSPQGAIIYTPNDQDTLKFMATKAVRMQTGSRARLHWLNTKEKSEPEKLENFELRWERQHDENLWFGISGYSSALDVIEWNSAAVETREIGVQRTWGLEGEFTYKKDNWELNASHGYTQLKDFDLNPGQTTELYSGNDLANWSTHITKVQTKYDITPKLSVNSSARIYWGYPGGERYAKVNGNIDDGTFSEAYDTSIFFNLGLGYQYNENLNLRLDGTNLIGLFDEEYNGRMITQGDFNDYRVTAPSVILSLNYKF